MNIFNFNWSLIQSFLAVLEHGSLMGAARATGVSQPTLGRHISELEDQLHLVLFERTGRGLQATQSALSLVESARAMAVGAANVSQFASGAGETLKGCVRLSASQPVACYLLPSVLARMRQSLPELVVDLVVTNSVSNLLRRDADIALRMVRPDQASLVTKRIGKVQIQACASRAYLQHKGTPMKAKDLVGHDLITGDSNTDIEIGLSSHGLQSKDIRIALRTDDLTAQWTAVQAGLGIGFMADYLVQCDPQVQVVLPAIKLPTYPIWLTVHRELRTSARIRAVYDFLTTQVPQQLTP